jgi:ABC-type polysaccharide/polyol phosphate export permease
MERVWDIFVSALFYATPVFYRAEAIDAGVRKAVDLNPMTHFLAVFRSVLLEGPPASVRSWGWCLAAAAGALAAGLACMREKEMEIAERVMC